MYITLTEELSVLIGNNNSNAVMNLFHYDKYCIEIWNEFIWQ